MIVEDFAYECADEKTLRWFTSATRLLAAADLLGERDELLDEVLRQGPSLAIWRAHHDHDLNTAAAIEAELEAAAGKVAQESAAYYFRYLARAMADSERRDAVVQALAEQETELIASASITSLGRRFVAPAPPS